MQRWKHSIIVSFSGQFHDFFSLIVNAKTVCKMIGTRAHVDGSLPQFKFDCLYIMPVTVHVDGSLPQFKFVCLYMVPVTVVNCKDGDIAS